MSVMQKIFNELPYEVQFQLRNVLSDDRKTLDQVDLPFIINEVKWTIERMQMDIGESSEPEEQQKARMVIHQCNQFLKKYPGYTRR